MGRTAGALEPAPTATAEGPATEEGPAEEEGLAAAMSAAGDLATAEEGPTAEGDGPWSTCGLKVWAHLVFSISEPEKEQLEKKS